MRLARAIESATRGGAVCESPAGIPGEFLRHGRGAVLLQGMQAHLAGENAFSFGLLYERAHYQAIACQNEAQHAWRRTSRRKSRSWLPKS